MSAESAEKAKTSAAYLLFYIRRTEKIGGKTHDILASHVNTPSLSKEGSPEPDGDQPFRSGGGSHGPQSNSFDQESSGQYSRRSQGFGIGFHRASYGEDLIVEDDPMNGLESPCAGSPAVSEDGVFASARSPQIPAIPPPHYSTTEYTSGSAQGSIYADEGEVHNIRLSPRVIARAARDIGMEGTEEGTLDQIE